MICKTIVKILGRKLVVKFLKIKINIDKVLKLIYVNRKNKKFIIIVN